MKKIVLFASVCGLGLVAAAPPTGDGYPPCSATVTDRCIQLYERGVATPANLALNERLGPNNSAMAMGGPFEPVAEYPAATQDEYAENWSDYPQDAGADVMAAEDASHDPYADEQYAENEWAGEEPAGDWSGFEDQADY